MCIGIDRICNHNEKVLKEVAWHYLIESEDRDLYAPFLRVVFCARGNDAVRPFYLVTLSYVLKFCVAPPKLHSEELESIVCRPEFFSIEPELQVYTDTDAPDESDPYLSFSISNSISLTHSLVTDVRED